MPKNSGKLIWAVDAFADDSALTKKLAAFLKRWVNDTGTLIEPVYVLTPDQLRVPFDLFEAVRSESESDAKQNLGKMASQLSPAQALPPTLLVSSDMSLRRAVRTLVDYARTSGAELIAVGAQSKRAVGRFLFGSFGETLILQSDIPVLLITPKTIQKGPFKSVLFATDLSDASRQSFAEVVKLAKRQKLRIVLFNKVEYLTDATLILIEKNPLHKKYVETDLLRRRKALEALADEARASGVKANIVIDSRAGEPSIPDAILSAVQKQRVDLIAVSSQSGPMASAILGSVARAVVRRATCAVWVIHSKNGASASKMEQT